uniref:ATP-dependent DNA helicase n=1 Tax=Rhizophagus irregularis (strain DAOM 181602 / DAOM 197198 / MUCL 43194) TaxID=747089 RepID=U9UPJ1_RHIID
MLSEEELLGNYTSYRERYLSLHSDFQSSIQNSTIVTAEEHRHSLQNQFNTIVTNILEDLANHITPQIADILTKQLDALKLISPVFSQSAILNLPEEQCSGGTGKSYIIRLIIDWIKSENRTYLLTAPTGVAAQNVSGITIHSALRIIQSGSEEVSIVSSFLFNFISNLFARIHNSDIAFGGISVIAVGDLAQLPPVRGRFLVEL